jgi:ABC-type sugar transport system ATPase subunit
MLEICDLTKRYGEVVALHGASFRVAPGRIVGFLGPNGAGKTTTMRTIFGLVRPDRGEVRWRGRPVGPGERARFGYMPEERGLYPKMKVGEQLSYFAELSGIHGADANEAAGHPGGGRGGGARHPRSGADGSDGKDRSVALAISPRMAETIAMWSSGREDREAKPSATTHVERGDQARVSAPSDRLGMEERTDRRPTSREPDTEPILRGAADSPGDGSVERLGFDRARGRASRYLAL